MKAIMLLTTNPGHQEKAYDVVAHLEKDPRVTSITHTLGRFDGVIACECPDPKALNQLAEFLRKDGVFHTETLIEVAHL